jgi:hypothetical protein
LRLSPVSRTIAEIVPQSKALPRTLCSSRRFGQRCASNLIARPTLFCCPRLELPQAWSEGHCRQFSFSSAELQHLVSLLFQKVTTWPLTCSQELLVPVPGMQMRRSTAHAAMPAAIACAAARAVAAAHQAGGRAGAARWRSGQPADCSGGRCRNRLKKRRCQVPQVDITELADLLMVAWAMYSLYGFFANNDDRPTSL